MLILFVFLFLLSSSDGTDKFDSSRCLIQTGEMACFVPRHCFLKQEEQEGLSISRSREEIDNCSALIAIRPYSKSKWLVVMRGNEIDPDGLKFVSGTDKMLFHCKQNGDPPLDINSNRFKEKSYSTVGDGSYFHCEFEVTASSQMIVEDTEELHLKYSKDGKASEESDANSFWHLLAPKVNCNPGDIQFNSITSEEYIYEEVDAHRLTVACSLNSSLEYRMKDEEKFIEISSLTCKKDSKNDKKYKYQVNGDQWIQKGTPFQARCSRKRCLFCPNISSCTTVDCVSPQWTEGYNDTCASLECEGDRFDVTVGNAMSKTVQKPRCLDGKWRIDGSTIIAKAQCTAKTCESIKCNGCVPSTASTKLQCGQAEERLIMTSGGEEVTIEGELLCDGKTGKWKDGKGKEWEEKKDDDVSFTCGRVASMERNGVSGAKTSLLICGILLTLISGGAIILIFFILFRLRRRRSKPSPPSSDPTPPLPSIQKQDKRTNDTSTATSNTSNSQPDVPIEKETAIPRPPRPPQNALPISTPTAPRSSTQPIKTTAPSTVIVDDDHGYVVIDPEVNGSVATQHVGILPAGGEGSQLSPPVHP